MTTVGEMPHCNDMEIELSYISIERSRHGKKTLYVRYRGHRIRLREIPGTPEFLDEYRKALASAGYMSGVSVQQAAPNKVPALKRDYPRGSFGWLVLKYFSESPTFKAMKPAGQRRRRSNLEPMAIEHGHRPMIIPTQAITAGLAKRVAKPEAANEWLKSMKALYTWAKGARIIKDSPAAGISKIKNDTDGFHTWTIEEMRVFIVRHPRGTMAYLALILLLFTGLRRSDAVRIGRQHVSNETIRFRTSKTGAELVVRLPWPLADAISALREGSDLPLLQSAQGRAFASGAAFGNWFKDRATEAGIAHCSPHGLRKAGASIAAEMGASEVELDAMYGWSNPRQSGTYTRAARNLILATTGFGRIADALVGQGLLAPPDEEQNMAKSVAPFSSAIR